MIVVALALAYAGMTAMCLAMRKHYRQIWNRDPVQAERNGLRIAGWILLIISLGLCITGWGGSIGPVAWFGMLSVTGLILIFLLPYLPRLIVSLGVLAPLLSLIGVYSA